MEEWIEKRITDLCILGRGRVISTKEVSENPGIFPVYSSQTAKDGEMGQISTYDFEGKYVTWTTDGANAGTVFYRTGKFNCTNVCGTLSSKGGISMKFLAYILGSVAKRYVSYVGNPKLMNNIVSGIKLKIPKSKKEQSTIATVLSTVDKAIDQTEKLIAKYERIKTGLLQDLLTRGIDKQGNIRSEETHEFQYSPLGRIPKEWRIGTVGKDCRIHNSFRKPLSAEVRENMKGKYPYYGPTGILDYINEFRVEGKYVLIGEDGDHFLKFKTQEMTLLINGKFNVNNHAHILEGKDECITEWIHCFFCHRDITYHLTRQGAGRFKLNKAALSNLQIVIPNKDEQIRIIEKVDEIRRYIKCEEETLNNFRKLKDGLMQDLLTGKVSIAPLMKQAEATL
jgi:type I restriction enzyme S subunit